MRKLLIAQHSETLVENLQEALQNEWEIHVCVDSYPVIDMMRYIKPQAMLLDLNLRPKNGITVLEEGQAFLPPAIVATSNVVNEQILKDVHRLGVGAFVRIPFRLEHIKEQLNKLDGTYSRQSNAAAWHLRALGVNPKLSGYRCLLSAILILAGDSHLLMKEVYPAVAAVCGYDDIRSVERVIRTAIYNAWSKRRPVLWAQYFPVNEQGDIDKPSNKHFISRLAQEL